MLTVRAKRQPAATRYGALQPHVKIRVRPRDDPDAYWEAVMAKYDALRDHLRRQGREVSYTFDDIAAMVPGGLPASAYRYEAWWSNGDRTHSQCQSWGDAGFDAYPDLARRVVRFVPTQGGRQ